MNKVPKLRFKEFSGEWELSNLDKLCEINPKIKYLPKEFKYIDLESIIDGILVKDKIIKLENAPSRAKRVLSNGDVLFQTVRPYQMNNYIFNSKSNIPTVASTGYAQLRSKKNISDNKFIYQIIHNKKFNNNVMLRCTGTSYPAINSSELSIIQLRIPSLEEQQKIANFFSLIDKKIEKQQEKVEALKDYKKGMMQKIFSQEIRFKGDNGESFPEWEEKRFGEITNKVGIKNKELGNYEVYSISNKYGFIPQSDQFEESRLEDLDKSLYKIVNKGEFAYNPARINVGSIGLLKDNEQVIVSSLYVCFKFNHNMNNVFFEKYFSYNKFNKDVLRNVEGGVRQYLFYENFSRIKVDVPIIEEQQKIANLFSLIDKKLEKEQEKLDSLNQWKKGLLQQMFV